MVLLRLAALSLLCGAQRATAAATVDAGATLTVGAPLSSRPWLGCGYERPTATLRTLRRARP